MAARRTVATDPVRPAGDRAEGMGLSGPLRASSAAFASLTVWVRAGASRTRVGGRRGDALVVKVTSQAVDGAANDAVCRAVALALGLRPRQVELTHGYRSRSKVLRVAAPAVDLADAVGDLLEG